MNHRTPGLPVHHQLPEFTQTHVHRVGDAIQPSHPLSSPSPPAPNPSHQSIFQWVNSSHEVASESFPMSQLFTWGGQSIGVLALASVLPMNIQNWSPLDCLVYLQWTGWISFQSKGHSRVFSNTTVQKHQFLALSFLHSPTLTSIHDHRKNHSCREPAWGTPPVAKVMRKEALAYAKAGSNLRRPPVLEHLPPKPESAYFTVLCSHLHLWLYGGLFPHHLSRRRS